MNLLMMLAGDDLRSALLPQLLASDFSQQSSINLIYILQHCLQYITLIPSKSDLETALDQLETELACRVEELNLQEVSMVCHAIAQYNQSNEWPVKM